MIFETRDVHRNHLLSPLGFPSGHTWDQVMLTSLTPWFLLLYQPIQSQLLRTYLVGEVRELLSLLEYQPPRQASSVCVQLVSPGWMNKKGQGWQIDQLQSIWEAAAVSDPSIKCQKYVLMNGHEYEYWLETAKDSNRAEWNQLL